MSKITIKVLAQLYKFIKYYIFCQIYLEDSKKSITFAAEHIIAYKI